MIAGFGGSIFVAFLIHMLRAQGFPTSIQLLAQGIVFACAMGIGNLRLGHIRRLISVGGRGRSPVKS